MATMTDLEKFKEMFAATNVKYTEFTFGEEWLRKAKEDAKHLPQAMRDEHIEKLEKLGEGFELNVNKKFVLNFNKKGEFLFIMSMSQFIG